MAETQELPKPNGSGPKKSEDYDIPKPKPSEYGDYVGVDHNLPFSTPWIDDTYELLREEEELVPTVRQLMGMRRTDAQARALYSLLTLPIRSALRGATFVPPADAKSGGTKEAEFISNMFTLPPCAGGMEISFQRVMAQILMALFDGFSPFEQVYWSPKKGPLKGKITLQKLAYRPADTITFLTEKDGTWAGFRQRAQVHGEVIDVKIDRENAFYWAAREEERPFYGVSFFQSAFFNFDKKQKLSYLLHLAAQRKAVGTRVGTWPPNASEKDKGNFKKALSDFGLAQWIAHPETFKTEIQSDSGSQFDFLSLINHHNSQMSKSILASFFDKDQGGGAADAKLVDFGSQSDAMFLLMLQAIMDEIAAQINHYIIPKFIDWNFGSGKYPTFVWGTFTDEQRAEIQKTFDTLAVAAAPNVTPEFMFEIEKKIAEKLGLEIDYDTIEKEHEEQKKLQKQADEQALAYGQDPMAQEGEQPPSEGEEGAPEAGGGFQAIGAPPSDLEPQGAAQGPPGEYDPLQLSHKIGDLARELLENQIEGEGSA